MSDTRLADLGGDSARRLVADIFAALNSHALVSVTDRRGVILHANDRFCEVSQYPRSELVGRTHAVVNSGHHDPEFFAEMWRTIRRGESWRGVICNRAKDGSEYWVETLIAPILGDDGTPERYVSIRVEETRRHLAEEQVRRLAYVDAVTGLPNRAAMLAAMLRAVEHRAPGFCGFVTVSVDELSVVNDAFGFEAGELLLQSVATRILQLDHPIAAIARLGSGVFGLLLVDLGEERVAGARCREVMEELHAALSGPVDLGDGVVVDASVSIGSVLWADGSTVPADPVVSEDTGSPRYILGAFVGTDDPAIVVNSAEIARKRARQSGGHRRLRHFQRSMLDDARERVQLVSELRRGIERGELRLFAQPIVDRHRRVLGEEGLIRWRSPERGLIPPDEFIPLAEQTGMIIEIGEWVLDQACRQLAVWARDPATQHLTLSVNLSERQLRERDFAEQVRDRMDHYGVPAGKLKFELTESVLNTDLDRTIRLLSLLRADGVLTSLDDFGTGYSSLSYLRQLPVQQLKIDQSFVDTVVDNAQTAAVITMIVQLGRAFGLHVVAEGVETEPQFQRLAELGVDAFQGFLFSKPRPISEV
ncbi:EAL domain-containing protein [Leucobacter rhizosphaerae]|uniref:EAL domain-containing protein n=1 Tax=Leucobacter rhizosphaerae TaxID=2932245 RepID=A0ABY4FWA5_9MICO|nr:GGDEF domain-containing phosphodiesterase [Leucobacter rhizosphaerae]UOQ60570.1 EAL domain-containing protein [Leucobacter rhizosphaerae]